VHPVRALLLLILLTGCAASAAQAGEGSTFPAVPGWKSAPPPGDSVYTPENLWDIIDGAAELFLSYGFADLQIREFGDTTGTDVRVELYRHSSGANAFGIYSQERNPRSHYVEIGTQGYVEEKVLNFFAGFYYVKISSHRGGAEGRSAMELIARHVARHLHQESGWPAPLARLPEEGKLPNTECYIAENFLGYRSLHSAFTARYEGGCTLFLMEFGTPSLARGAAEAYAQSAGAPQSVKEGEITDVSDPHAGPVALLLCGRTLSGAFGAGGSPLLHRRLEQMRTRLNAAE